MEMLVEWTKEVWNECIDSETQDDAVGQQSLRRAYQSLIGMHALLESFEGPLELSAQASTYGD